MSSDGSYQTAIHYGGQIHTSSDYGVSWTARDSSRNWYDVELSPTGQYQTVVVYNGLIYISNNYTGGSTANCSANLKQDGACGTANGHNYAYTDTEWGAYTQCSVGTPSTTAFPVMGGSTNWTCSGINGGNTSSTCTATRDSSTNKSRQYYYAESIAVSSWNTDTNYQDKTTLTFTPDDNSTYLIIASWLVNESSPSYQSKTKLTRTTGTTKDFNELIYRPQDASDYISGGAIGIDTFGSSPESQTYKIQYTTSSTYGTASIKDAKIIALKLVSADQYAQSETRTTTSSTSYVDSATLTFTPDTQGDYIIIATATVDGSYTSYDFRTQLSIDGVASSISNIEPVYDNNRSFWGTIKKVNLTSASHTIKIQYSTEVVAYPAGISDARIIVLRADEFNNVYYDAAESRSTTASTSYINHLALTQTTPESNYLIIGSAGLDGAVVSESAYGQLTKDGVSYGEMVVETKDITNQGYPYFVIKKESLTNSQSIWRMQYRAETASYAAGIKDSKIAVLELMPDPIITISSVGTQTANVNKNTTDNYIGGAFTFQSNLGSVNLNQITISETGTIDANTNLSNLKLYYETAATCSYDGDETLFGTAVSFDSSQKATITGIMPIVSSRVCIYPILDIASGATAAQTIELEISNISTDITLSYGTTSGTSPIVINGTSTISNIINGACGSSDGQSFSSTPTENLCVEGNVTEVLGSGPWTWTCTGIDGGTTDNCSADINGSCGTANGEFANSETLWGSYTLCSAGTASPSSPTPPLAGETVI